jgi:hypothetical protein
LKFLKLQMSKQDATPKHLPASIQNELNLGMENIVNEPDLKYNNISAEAYLEQERAATEKHEYYRGEIFAMGGASKEHNEIFSNKRKRLQTIWQRFQGAYSQKYFVYLSRYHHHLWQA